MKIARIKVDGFGVWRDLEMAGLAGDVVVIYGPNEAGKTTLMQFVRSVLYGFSPDRRAKYLPPVRGGSPGGALSVTTPQGHFEIARRGDRSRETGDVVVTAPDGTQQGEPALRAMLGGIDESIFNNVYACGLREIQELGTLSETEAAQHLYDLTAGLDRVSLVDVERELGTSLDRLLAPAERPSRIGRLLAERTRLMGDLDTSRSGLARYHRLSVEQSALQRDVDAADEQHRQAEAHARLADLAFTLRDKWLERAEIAAQLAALGSVAPLPVQAVEKLDDLGRRIAKRTRKQAEENQRRRHLREEARTLAINDVLWRQGPRIEALSGQREWIVSVESRIAAAETEMAALESQIAALRARLGIGPHEITGTVGVLSHRLVRSLRSSSRALTAERRRRQEAQAAVEAAESEVQTAQREISSRLTARGESDLAVAMERCGALAAQLRRRMQIDERIAQLGHHQTELKDRHHSLLNRQMLPTGVLIGLGSVFVLGTLLVLVGLVMPTSLVGSFGWALAILGLLGSAAAGGGKFLLERIASRELDGCEKQLDMVGLQLKQGQEERDDLDRQLPRGGGPLPVRLKGAEDDLAALEGIVPLDARRQMATREAQAARGRVTEVDAAYRRARKHWRRDLRVAGLPVNLAPRQIRHMAVANHDLSTLQTQRDFQRAQAEQHRRELAASHLRVAQLAADAGVAVEGLGTAAVLERLAADLAQQESLVDRRNQLQRQAREARTAAHRHARRIATLHRRRQLLLRSCGVESHEDLRRRALAQARYEVLSRQHEVLSTEIASALGSAPHADTDDFLTRHMVNPSLEVLQHQRDEATARLTFTSQRLRDLHEQRGRLDEQVRTLSTDRGPAELQLELSMVERQLRDAIGRWQELALTRLLLDDIHSQFERERQPATLREASQYMNILTGGVYPRVWTPLGQRRLMVDDASGHSLAPESLSEGTREQLFLSLRLALVARYAQRGIELPLVLDDVLVNFDAQRAKAAARLLRDFAREGHQLLMFTCHEHIVKVFKAAKVETRCLPVRDSSGGVVTTILSVPEADTEPAPPSRRRRKAARPQPVEVDEEEDEVEEIPVARKSAPVRRPTVKPAIEDDEEEDSAYGVLGTDDDEFEANVELHERDMSIDEDLDDDYGYEDEAEAA